MKNKFAYFGTPSFSTLALDELENNGMIPEIIVTSPDSKVGRKQILTPSPVKLWAIERNIKVLQPVDIKDPLFIGELTQDNWDFFILAAYGKIIPKIILDMPKAGILNIHPSLLPKYRGPTPIQTAILSGDEETGVSIIILDEKMDHGPIVAQEKIKIDEHNKTDLDNILWPLGAKLIANTIADLLENKITPIEQLHSESTYTRKFENKDAYIEPSLILKDNQDMEEVSEAERMIRSLNPEPGTWTEINNKRIKILTAEIKDGKLNPIEIIPAGKQKCLWKDYSKNI